jgi:hypothetical protein
MLKRFTGNFELIFFYLNFSAVVLQRTTPDFPSSVYVPNSLKFTVAFNLAVVWMLVFVSLSKGTFKISHLSS